LEESFLMLWPKAWEILNGKFRNHSNALFFLVFLEGHISAFWDHTPVYACLRDFFFLIPFFGEWWQVAVTTVCGWWLWMPAGPFLWVALAVAGVTAALRESSGMG
jgi:hypothetical protein